MKREKKTCPQKGRIHNVGKTKTWRGAIKKMKAVMIDIHYTVLQVTSSGILIIKCILSEKKSYSKIVLCHTEND